MNSRVAFTIAVLGVSLAACSTLGARPSGSAGPSPADPTPKPSASAPATKAPDPTGTPQPSSTAQAKLDGREFVSVLVTENGKSKQLVTGTKVRLGFSDGSLSASAGCNHMSGDYRIVDGALVVDQLATTEIGCPTDLADQDEWLADFLLSKPAITVDDNALKEMSLANETAQIDFQDREVAEPDQPLTNITWVLTGFIEGDTVSSMPESVTSTVLFKDNGQVEVEFGCNRGGGQYSVDGDTITFKQIVSTEMACGGAQGDVESAVTYVIRPGDATFSIDHSSLTLLTSDGRGLMYSAAIDVD